MEQNLGNRWRFVYAAVIMQICLGILYAWSVFPPVLKAMNGWGPEITRWPYAFSLLFFTVGMIIAGFWQDKAGPKLVGSVGGVFLAVGCLMAAFTASNQGMFTFAYGILGGLGVGFAYVTPIATCVKWFPDKRGTIVGLAVLGFGGGTVIFGPVLENGQIKILVKLLQLPYRFLNLEGLQAQVKAGTMTEDVMKATLAGNIKATFIILALLFAVLVIGAAQVYRVPPAGYRPPGWTPPASSGPPTKEEFLPGEMIRTWQFWALWVMYVCGAGVGLVAIGQAKPVITSAINKAMAADPSFWLTGGSAVGMLSIFNALGRLGWGSVSDKIGRKMTTICMFISYIIACALLMLPGIKGDNWFLILIGICIIGFGYGGFLVMLPAFTADFFGAKKVGSNYGIVFTAWGISGFTNVIYTGNILKKAATPIAGFTTAFTVLLVLSIVGAGLTLILKRPMHEVKA